jgi:cell division protein FtsN
MAEKTRKRSPAKHRQASRPPSDQGRTASPVLWWLTGLIMGLVVAGLVHLEHTRPDPAPAEGETAASTDDDHDEPRFEFYRLLSEQEVDVAGQSDTAASDGTNALPSATPDESAASPATAPETPPEPTTASDAPPSVRYLLQAGSFRRQDDADALRANLALLDIEARIQEVELPGGETWHRVRIGPFDNLGEVNQVRQRMAGQQIDSILLRAGG